MIRLPRKAKVTLQGTDALTITEAKALITAAMAGRYQAMPNDVAKVESACEKIAEGLVLAGQDPQQVQAFLSGHD